MSHLVDHAGSLAGAGVRAVSGLALACWRMLRRWPVLWLTTALCLIIGENYPFSNYPMYATFSDSTYMVYVTDGDGEPVPVFDTFGMRTSVLKKVYHKMALEAARRHRLRIHELEPRHLEPAGRLALERLLAHRNDMPAHGLNTINLVHLHIVLENGRIVRRPMVVASRSLQKGVGE